MTKYHDKQPYKGRGALSNPDCRFDECAREEFDDGWMRDETQKVPKTTVLIDATRTVITRNASPDVPFHQSINPYRGCEHGCIYCFARPSHAYLGLSPGLDFETKILCKPNAAQLLEQELLSPSYRCEPIALGSNTDPYQPLERQQRITRQILEVLQRHRHPVAIVTKGALIERDIDILQEMASDHLIQVMISISSLDRKLVRALEPRAAAPQRRLELIELLHRAGIPTGVLVAPLIPVLTEPEIEKILQAAAQAGACSAAYVLLRLPNEVADLFEQWLDHHYPLHKQRLLNHVRNLRNGKRYESQFGARMTGVGNYADIIARRFDAACRRFGITERSEALQLLNCSAFLPQTAQFSLF